MMCQRRNLHHDRAAFTLVEILTVLAIIGLLAALIFPAFNRVREYGRRTQCLSNLRQLGLAMQQYTSDYQRFPRGLDFSDDLPGLWEEKPEVTPELLAATPLLTQSMAAYAGANLWKCPSDFGLDEIDITGHKLDGHPSCAGKFGMSYLYRTELTLLNLAEDVIPRPAETNVLMDASGDWHGALFGSQWSAKRYNVLFADGHSKNLNREAYEQAWNVPVLPGTD